MTYVLKRALQAIIVLLVTYTAVFVFVSLIPNDVIQNTFNGESQLPAPVLDELRRYYGLDKPLLVQYVDQLAQLLRGNFGYSISNGQTVTERVGSVIGYTLQLAGLALVFAVVISAVLLYAWVTTESERTRGFVRAIPEFLASVPVFVVGIVVILIFSFKLGWISLFSDGSLRSTIVPALVLSLPISAPLAQVLLQGVESAQSQPYVQTARAKGLPPLRVLKDHVLKNVAGPFLTVLGLNIGALLAGSVVTETVFARTGLGSILLQAVVTQDVQLIQGLVLLTSLTVVLVNLIIDLAYAVLDPRVGLSRRKTGRAVRRSDTAATLVGV